MKCFFNEITNEPINRKASAIAFSFTLAIFPAIIFLFTMIPYIPISGFGDQLIELLGQLLPKALFSASESTIVDIVSRQRGGLLSLGFLLLLYTSSNGLMALMDSFDKKNESFRRRGGIKKRGIAMVLTICLSVLMFIAIILLMAGNFIIDKMEYYGIFKEKYIYYLLMIFNKLIVTMIFLVVISGLYFFLPPVRTRWKFFSIGSIVATLLSLAASYSFSLYLGHFARFNKLYGSIGAIIALMVWFYIISFVIIIGFEINASIYVATFQKTKKIKAGNYFT